MSYRLSYKKFTPQEHKVWSSLFIKQAPLRRKQIHEIFDDGVKLLSLPDTEVPNLDTVNVELKKLTGFRGIPVEGLEKDASFFEMLSNHEFPIGNFIRDAKDLSYTPAPDVFHDLYGHLPFLADKAYAEFSHEIGRRCMKYADSPAAITQFSRLYWFGVEFPLVETEEGRRIFGAGIASSFSECAYALSDQPEVIPFDIEKIRRNDFRIDDFQRRIYILKSPEQLYDCLDDYEAGLLEAV
jgi:phenylalanine-4-hydroxylase